MKNKILLFAVSLIFLPACLYPAAGNPPALPLYTDEVLVVYKAEFLGADLETLNAKYGMNITGRADVIKFMEKKYDVSRSRRYLPESFFACYRISGIENMESIVESLKAEPVVEHVQPNFLFHTQTASYVTVSAGPNDDRYINTLSQWYLNQTRVDKVYAEMLPFTTPQEDVVVAVVDTGVDIGTNGGHEDLIGVTVTGRNILDPGTLPYDDDGHGTHVAGIIGARTNNSTGMAGTALNVTWSARVKIMPVKALDSTGSGTDADIYTGIVWAADNGADIINLSLGGPSADLILKTGINYAYNKGCLIIAASGNSDSKTFYPAAYSNVMSVAASDMLLDACGQTYDAKADFSNWGKIDIAAPGENILSTSNAAVDSYSTASGTSFSSPVVAGIAALVKMKYPSYNNEKIRSVLEQTADDDYHVCSGSAAGMAGYDKYFGWGRVNAYRALNLDMPVLSTPEIKTYNWPNPFSPDGDGFTNIVFTVNVSQKVTAAIFDGGNELVWEKTLQPAEVSAVYQNTVKWDGKNRDGKKTANGVYFYIIKTESGAYGKNKIAVLY